MTALVDLGRSLALAVVRALLSTIRARLHVDPRLEGDSRPRVLFFRHGLLTALLALRAPRETVALVSRSRDGDLAAHLAEARGLRVVRGSTSRGAVQGLRGLVRALRRGLDVAVTVDGPKGPRGSVSGGAALAARLGGAALVPVRVEARLALTLPTWDAHLLPLPFCQVDVHFGAPLAEGATAAEMRAALGEGVPPEVCGTTRVSPLSTTPHA